MTEKQGKIKTKELQQMVANRAKKQNKDEIQTLVDIRVREILECNAEKIDKEIFYKKLDQAKIGMIYVRDRAIMKRVTTGHMIRVINLIATDANEREAYVKASMPEITPIKQLE